MQLSVPNRQIENEKKTQSGNNLHTEQKNPHSNTSMERKSRKLVSFRTGDSDIYCHKFLNLFSFVAGAVKIENRTDRWKEREIFFCFLRL